VWDAVPVSVHALAALAAVGSAAVKIVEVHWEDHAFGYGDQRPERAEVFTCGYLVEETDEHVLLALSLSDGRPHEMQLIDKRMLVKMTTVRKEQ
jgi:hypothetical protein